MADLSISQIIQESLLAEDGEQAAAAAAPSAGDKKDKGPGWWDKTKTWASSTKDRAMGHIRAGMQGTGVGDRGWKGKTLYGIGKGTQHVLDNKWKYGAGAAAAGAAGGAYLWHKHKQNSGVRGAVKKYGKAAAATSLAAIGAGVGAKALLKYLRKKKKQG